MQYNERWWASRSLTSSQAFLNPAKHSTRDTLSSSVDNNNHKAKFDFVQQPCGMNVVHTNTQEFVWQEWGTNFIQPHTQDCTLPELVTWLKHILIVSAWASPLSILWLKQATKTLWSCTILGRYCSARNNGSYTRKMTPNEMHTIMYNYI